MAEKLGCIYLITNTVNGRRYVGQTRHPTPTLRFRGHMYNAVKLNTPLCCDIRIHGKQAFIVETLSVVPHSSLNNMEAYWAEQLETYVTDPPLWGPRGYNIRECGTDPTEYVKPVKMSSWWIGRKHKPESLIKIGNVHRGKIATEETRAKLSASHKGLTPTPEAKEAARKNRIKSVIENGAKGVKLSKDDILSIVEAAKTGTQSQKELAEKYGVQISVVSRILSGKRWGYITGIQEKVSDRKRRGTPLGIETATKIRDLYASGTYTYNELASQYNVNRTTIANIIKAKLYPNHQEPSTQ